MSRYGEHYDPDYIEGLKIRWMRGVPLTMIKAEEEGRGVNISWATINRWKKKWKEEKEEILQRTKEVIVQSDEAQEFKGRLEERLRREMEEIESAEPGNLPEIIGGEDSPPEDIRDDARIERGVNLSSLEKMVKERERQKVEKAFEFDTLLLDDVSKLKALRNMFFLCYREVIDKEGKALKLKPKNLKEAQDFLEFIFNEYRLIKGEPSFIGRTEASTQHTETHRIIVEEEKMHRIGRILMEDKVAGILPPPPSAIPLPPSGV